MKRFTVIAVDYENHVPREAGNPSESPSIERGLRSLANQTFKDFNVVLCHDGPKDRSYADEGIDFDELGLDVTVISTDARYNRFGHPSRDHAMRYAYENNMGEFYIGFNVDNFFFPDAFEKIDQFIDECDSDIVIFPVHHWKHVGGEIFYPLPPVYGNIDVMQLVASAEIWKNVGFWYSNEFAADGVIYDHICKTNRWQLLDECLGHNY